MSSSEDPTGSEPLLVRTTGPRPVRGEGADGNGTFEGAFAPGEVRRLRERVAELQGRLERTGDALADRETRVEELTAELEGVRRERDDAREWAAFLDRELREHRERVGTLEDRVETLESGTSLFARLRGLLG